MFDPIEEHKRQQTYVDWIERLNGGAAQRIEWQKLRDLFDHLTEGCPFVLHPLDQSSKFARGRIMNSEPRPNLISEIGPLPAAKCTDFGRCHRPGSPILYAGVGTELVLEEIGARPGDVVALLHMKPKKKLFCVRSGALNLWRRSSGHCLMHEDIKAAIAKQHADPRNITAFLLDGFIADHLGRAGSEDVYKITSAYVAAVLDARRGISGVIYDSVDFPGGTCVALRDTVFSRSIDPTDVQFIEVTSYLGYGIFDFKVLAQTDRFVGNQIIW